MSESTFTFPVGYHRFHKDQVFNFQLNRWHSLGYVPFEEVEAAGKKISTFSDWKREMTSLAERALSEGRLMNAAFYYRAAEFYVLNDYAEKERLYDKFIELFCESFKDDEIDRFGVPYGDSLLPVMNVPSAQATTKGTIVMHGGFDSWIEEFYSWMRYFAYHGYDVIAFEGPGQGGALKKRGLVLDYRWEKPAQTILDYLDLDDVTWLGISMGGWFCFRAAAFEPRIKRVIASGIAFDYMKGMNVVLRKIHLWFLEHMRDFTNRMYKKSLKKERGVEAWMIANLMHITGEEEPMAAFEVWLELNERNLHSELVEQDVLILTGRDDHLIPFKMHDLQVKALTSARSVTPRVFTEDEHAQNHCQIGNLGLALEVMVKWIAAHS